MLILMESKRPTVLFVNGLNTLGCSTKGVNLIIFLLVLCSDCFRLMKRYILRMFVFR